MSVWNYVPEDGIKNKIVYSVDIMRKLVERNYLPIRIMPNPTNPKYSCWIFKWSEEFQKDLDKIFEEKARNGRA